MQQQEQGQEQEQDQQEKLRVIAKDLAGAKTWSDKIRVLFDAGFSNGEIAKILTELRGKLLRPQHVHNVLSRPLKRPTKEKGRDAPTNGGSGPGRPQTPLSKEALTLLEMARNSTSTSTSS